MKELISTNTAVQIISEQVFLAQSAKTYDDIIQNRSLRLESLSDRIGSDAVLQAVVTYISDTCELMAFEITPKMILTASQMIFEDYPDTKVAAFSVFKREVLYGNIKPKGGKTFRMDANTLLEMWQEFYLNMANTACDYFEAKHRNFYEPDKPINTDKVIPMPEYVKETFKKVSEKMRINAEAADANRPVLYQKLSLDEIAELEGIDKTILADVIRLRAEQIHKDEKQKIPIHTILASELASIQFEARQNPKYLHELVKQ